jgi:phosphoglycolate phosphatase
MNLSLLSLLSITQPKGFFMLVLLFDIDGTLVRTGGAGKAAMELALTQEFGVKEILDVVPYSGRTDPAIGRDLLEVHGLAITPENLEKLHEAYLNHLSDKLSQVGGHLCPGITELLHVLQTREEVQLGLLTGNMRRGAEKKLAHFGIWDRFDFGGFGDGRTNRDDVARAALADAERHLQKSINPDRVWVIGDTPLDVSCARAIGAKALAVATGWHPIDELHATGADAVFDNLSDTAAVLRLW